MCYNKEENTSLSDQRIFLPDILVVPVIFFTANLAGGRVSKEN